MKCVRRPVDLDPRTPPPLNSSRGIDCLSALMSLPNLDGSAIGLSQLRYGCSGRLSERGLAAFFPADKPLRRASPPVFTYARSSATAESPVSPPRRRMLIASRMRSLEFVVRAGTPHVAIC